VVAETAVKLAVECSDELATDGAGVGGGCVKSDGVRDAGIAGFVIICPENDGCLGSELSFTSQFTRSSGGESSYGGLYDGLFTGIGTKLTAATYYVLGLCSGLEWQAASTAQLVHHMTAVYAHELSSPLGAHASEIECGENALSTQARRETPADAPDVSYTGRTKSYEIRVMSESCVACGDCFIALEQFSCPCLLACDSWFYHEDTEGIFVGFGPMIGEFAEGFSRCNTDAHGYADVF